MWSTDLVNWTARDAYNPNPYNSDPFFNDAFPVPPSWSVGGAVQLPGKAQWAPGVAKIGGAWVAYTAWEIAPGRRCISAARASSPAGPFVDLSPNPIVCDPDAAGSIDAAPVIDASGQPWLTWKAEGGDGLPARIYSQALSADGLSFKAGSAPNLLLVSVLGWEGLIVENPSMVYSGGAYWLVYSGNAWESSSYRMGQARCDGPAGPCQRSSSAPLIPNTATDLGPGGGSLFVDASGRTRLAYHVWNAPFSSYPADPNCDGPGICASRGQRYLRMEGVAAWKGRLTTDPIGSLDQVVVGPGSVSVAGWALDPSVTSSIAVHVYLDNTLVPVVANGSRPDLAGVFPGLGTAHGFGASVSAGPGAHQLCVYGIGADGGANAPIDCRVVVVPSGPPFGAVDLLRGNPSGVTIAGWAIDPDTTASIPVHVYVDGTVTGLMASGVRNDVGAVYPGNGSAHGFSATLAAAPGRHDVCIYAINVGPGSSSLLGCQTVVVPGGSPIGTVDVAKGVTGGVLVEGWSLDPDTANSTDVHVYVDDVATATTASFVRSDVGAAYPGYGSAHGYGVIVPAGAGAHSMCAYGINVGGGDNSLLGCRIVVVPDTSPFGSLDVVVPSTGAVFVGGWAIDPDTASPIAVHVYVDDTVHGLTASGPRPDVGGLYPSFGANHGYGSTIAAPPGEHAVCAFAINVAAGDNRLLGCRTVTVG
jgi:hypothetical protein